MLWATLILQALRLTGTLEGVHALIAITVVIEVLDMAARRWARSPRAQQRRAASDFGPALPGMTWRGALLRAVAVVIRIVGTPRPVRDPRHAVRPLATSQNVLYINHIR
ncbi:hypothetical protein [Nocardia sp. NPDC056000]|uniref:hypothetical protein n=1 Tax=Nocardia sp. NPDC056000 TaxID=3345674 RepID=UPI0035D7C79E